MCFINNLYYNIFVTVTSNILETLQKTVLFNINKPIIIEIGQLFLLKTPSFEHIFSTL